MAELSLDILLRDSCGMSKDAIRSFTCSPCRRRTCPRSTRQPEKTHWSWNLESWPDVSGRYALVPVGNGGGMGSSNSDSITMVRV